MRNKIKKIIKTIFRPIDNYRTNRIKRTRVRLSSTPKKLVEYLYKLNFNREINWDNPIELNEKIRWIQFNTDTSLWTKLADKYLARFFVQEKGYESILVKLYGVWKNAEDIDFNMLPDSFVIKTNHGCGEVIIVKDKKTTNLEDIRSKMKMYLCEDFGLETAEMHYRTIPRRIIAEELLQITSPFSTSMVDYKFYCINGEPKVCGVFFNRDPMTHKTWSSFYDMDWQRHPEWRRNDIDGKQGDVPCPKTFAQMKQACRDLCNDIPFCRLDFYESDGKLYFGEFTFTPAVCSGGSMNKTLCYKLGEKLVLPVKTRN